MTTKRRRKGTGQIERMPNGTFVPRMPGHGGRLRPCATYEDAETLLDEVERLRAITRAVEQRIKVTVDAQS